MNPAGQSSVSNVPAQMGQWPFLDREAETGRLRRAFSRSEAGA
jgi:hypothetical protein